MTKSIRTTLTAIAFLAVASLTLVNCSDDKKTSSESSFAADVIDSLAVAVAETVVAPALTQPAVAVDSGEEAPQVSLVRQVSDVMYVEPNLYATFDGGLIVYNFDTKKRDIVEVDDNLKAVAMHEGAIYAGGDNLYTFADGQLTRVDYEFPGVVNKLLSYEYRLLIGTDAGLYGQGIFGREELMKDVSVNALAADNDGLWIGTNGQGLYRWDGEQFKKRYLERDEALFDTVYTLAFSRNHLYMGGSNGFHVFDGGRWLNLSEADGLPAGQVTAIDASDWVVYVATATGVTTWFQDEFQPITKLAEQPATAIAHAGRKVIIATPEAGILEKSGRVVNTLVDPVIETDLDVLSLLQ
jgi:ligand-binding sensor domain-containing protein